MINTFEVVTDTRGRIRHFIPNGLVDSVIQPEAMAENINGGERVTLKDEEYDLTPNGSLVHPDVEILPKVKLGAGALIQEGTSFHEEAVVGERARIVGTEVCSKVNIGSYAVLKAQRLGKGVSVGEHTRIGPGTVVQANANIAGLVRIDAESLIAEGAQIEERVRLGYKTRVGSGAVVGKSSRLGDFQGARNLGVNQDGIYVASGLVLPPGTRW